MKRYRVVRNPRGQEVAIKTRKLVDPEQERKRIKNLADRALSKFMQSLAYVDLNGEPIKYARKGNPWHELYLEGLKQEAEVFATLVHTNLRKQVEELELKPKDCKSWEVWAKIPDPWSRTDGLPVYHELTKRARKMVHWHKENILDPIEEKTRNYHLLAPHTFCFVEVPNSLDQIMNDTFLKKVENYEISGGWLRSPLAKIVKENEIIANGRLYVSPDNRLKLKIFTSHEYLELTDILDVEAQFKSGKFEDIVHYHVEKPFTLLCLSNSDFPEIIPECFEMSGNPRTGKVRVVTSGAFVDETRETIEIPEAKQSIIGMRYWGTYPIIAGGNLLDAAVKIIENEGKYETLVSQARRAIR